MAKDPAFLFYPNDWLGGTMYFSFEQKGCYLELLLLQFNTGKFTETQVKQVLNTSFSQWDTLKAKFKNDGGALWWNEKLAGIVFNRATFTESRRNNRLGKKKITSVKHKKNTSNSQVQLMENGNENENKDVNASEKENKAKPKNVEQVIEYFEKQNVINPKQQAEKFFNHYEAKGWMLGKNKVIDWKACVKTWDLPKKEEKKEKPIRDDSWQ